MEDKNVLKLIEKVIQIQFSHIRLLFYWLQKELVLYPSKNGKVTELLEEAKKQVDMEPEGSGRLRYVSLC